MLFTFVHSLYMCVCVHTRDSCVFVVSLYVESCTSRQDSNYALSVQGECLEGGRGGREEREGGMEGGEGVERGKEGWNLTFLHTGLPRAN